MESWLPPSLKQNVSLNSQVLSEEGANPYRRDRIEDADLSSQNGVESAAWHGVGKKRRDGWTDGWMDGPMVEWMGR